MAFARPMEAKRPRVFYGWWIVGATVFVGLYVGGVIVYGLTALFDPIVEEFGWSYATISLAASLRGAESGLLEPVVGGLVDRWGGRRIIFAGALFTAAGLFLLSRTTSLAMFYGAFLLLAAGMGACGPTALVTGVANWFHARLGLATGIALSGYGLGGLMLPVMILLIEELGWRSAFAILGAGSLALVLPVSLVIRHKPEQYGYLPDGRAPEAAAPAKAGSSSSRRSADEAMDLRHAVRTVPFWLLAAAFTILTASNITAVTHIMPYLESVGFPRMSAGAIATAVPLLSVIGRLGLGAAGDRLSPTRVTALAFTMMCLGLLCFAAVPVLGGWTIGAFLLLLGIGYGGVAALRPAVMREYVGRAHFGSIFGLVMGVNALGGIIGPPLAGRAFDTTGDYGAVWVTLAILSAAAACLVLLARRWKPVASS